MHFAGVDLATAVRMAVDHPARVLGFTPGALEIGARADFVLFDLSDPQEASGPRKLNVRTTLVSGQLVAGQL
jgi:cytosine/adenosine deaminase-related metal-dependent hydrolase